MKINDLLILAAFAAMLGTGCVSTQKYKDMQTARDHFKAQYENERAAGQENEELKGQVRPTRDRRQPAEDRVSD